MNACVRLAAACTAVSILTLLSGCVASSAERDVPAVITNPTPSSRGELKLAVQRVLHSNPILLADDALTESDLLSIDRVVRRDAEGRPLNGLDVRGRPELFRLVKAGNDCVLIYLGLEQIRQRLAATTCLPKKTQR